MIVEEYEEISDDSKSSDRDKVAYSIKPYAFTLLSNGQSKCQKVIEIEDEGIQDVSVSERGQ